MQPDFNIAFFWEGGKGKIIVAASASQKLDMTASVFFLTFRPISCMYNFSKDEMLVTVIVNFSKSVFTRHLQRSGHMQSFVLVSEEAISKGIRRIVALTGPEALKAEKKCHLLEEQVEKIQNLVQEKMRDSSLNIKGTSQEIARLTEVRINSASNKIHILRGGLHH